MKKHYEVLNESEPSCLSFVSGLGASEFGDPVHWARGVLSGYTMELPEAYHECGAIDLEERTVISHRKWSMSRRILIRSHQYPQLN